MVVDWLVVRETARCVGVCLCEYGENVFLCYVFIAKNLVRIRQAGGEASSA